MSKYEKQEELLLRLSIENQKLMSFKKLNNLMSSTLKFFADDDAASNPFARVFNILGQEFSCDVQAIINLDSQDTVIHIVSSSDSRISALHNCYIDKEDADKIEKKLMEESAIFFDTDLSPSWPEIFKKVIPEARSALTQPFSIGSKRYVLIFFAEHVNNFNSDAKFLTQSYVPFITSLMSLLENKRLTSERNDLFNRQKRIEQSMIRQDKLAAIGQLAAGVAHELNNPLGLIYSNLNTFSKYIQTLQSFLNSALNSPSELRQLAENSNIEFILEDTSDLINESLEGARRSRDIISNLRTFSHPDETSVATLDIIKIINQSVKIAKTKIKNQTTLQFFKEFTYLYVKGNATQISQVLLNLISNAHDAITEKAGIITITVEKIENYIYIKVKDNGSGIDDSVKPYIFEPFYTTKEIGKGTGLGLSLSKALIEQHNGNLFLESSSTSGSEFVIVLPEA